MMFPSTLWFAVHFSIMFNQFSTLDSICGSCVFSDSHADFVAFASCIIFLFSLIFSLFSLIFSSFSSIVSLFALIWSLSSTGSKPAFSILNDMFSDHKLLFSVSKFVFSLVLSSIIFCTSLILSSILFFTFSMALKILL